MRTAPNSGIISKHLADNQARIEQEARKYQASYGCTYEVALRDVTDEYVQGCHDEDENSRY